jgi:leader peptidase (prepilin peptidase)/N-methyltransferase
VTLEALGAWSVLIAGLTGLAVGSFLNVCIDRLQVGRSIATVPSHCEACGHRLKILDLVPVVSYLWLRGKCRYCSVEIPRRIPIVEIATGAIFAFVVYRYGLSTASLTVTAYASVLIVIFLIDLERQLILNAITYPSIIVALLVTPWGPLGEGVSARLAYQDALLGFLLGGGVLLLVFVIARGGFGAGDVKLGALLGIMLGFVPTLVTLEMSFIAGGLVATLLILLKIRRRKDQVPFGPFLAGAGIISLFWGQWISNWYQNLLGL